MKYALAFPLVVLCASNMCGPAVAEEWTLTVQTGPRMDDGAPISYPSTIHFRTRADCQMSALKCVKERTLPGQVTTDSCAAGEELGEREKVYERPVPVPEVYVVLIGRAHAPEGLRWEPQSVWPTKEQCKAEADKKQSEAASPD